MRDEQMPDHRLKRLAVRRDVSRVDRRHNDTRRRFLRSVTAVASNDADNRGANLPGELNCADEIWADVFLQIPAADGENEQAVLRVQPAAFEPLGENRGPAFVVGAGSQFGNVVGGRISLESADFTEVVDGVAGVGRAAADAEDEQPSAALAHARQFGHGFFDGVRVEFGDKFLDFVEELFGKTHGLLFGE